MAAGKLFTETHLLYPSFCLFACVFWYVLLERPLFTAATFLLLLLEKKTRLPTHMKVELCRILEKEDGAYWVVLNKLFPPEKIKRVHRVVFKYEVTKKCQLTLEQWHDIFLKCDKLQDFYDVVKKYTGQDPWISKYKNVSLPLGFYT